MIEFTYEDDDGNEVVVEFPSKMEVCSECQGHGTHLMPGLKGHAFSAEEFNDTFDDDESRSEYFKRGGRYDVQCETCHGKNVVPVIDEEACDKDPALAEALAIYYKRLRYNNECDRTVAAERRFGC